MIPGMAGVRPPHNLAFLPYQRLCPWPLPRPQHCRPIAFCPDVFVRPLLSCPGGAGRCGPGIFSARENGTSFHAALKPSFIQTPRWEHFLTMSLGTSLLDGKQTESEQQLFCFSIGDKVSAPCSLLCRQQASTRR